MQLLRKKYSAKGARQILSALAVGSLEQGPVLQAESGLQRYTRKSEGRKHFGSCATDVPALRIEHAKAQARH